MDDFPENCVGRWSNNYTSEEPMNSVLSFREQKAFVVKTIFLLAFGLGICEGVGEDSGHGIDHVDIRVGS